MIPIVLLLAMERPQLTLDDALRAAIDHQPLIVQAHAQSEAARARAGEALAPMLPQVAVSASYERGTGNRTARIGSDPRFVALLPQPTSQLYDYWRFQATVTQLVFDFGQSYHLYKSARTLAEAQELAEQATRQTVSLGARSAFFVALADRELVDVARQTLANQHHHLEQVEAFVQAKARPEIDLSQSKLDVANAEVALVAAESAYDQAREQLNGAMGVVRGIDYDVAKAEMPSVPGEDGPVDALLEEALHERPEIASLSRQVKAQDALVRAAYGGYGPTLSVQIAGSDIGGGTDQLRWNASAIATATWTLFDGAYTPSRVSEARGNLQAVEAQLEQLRLVVRTEVLAAQVAVMAAKTVIEAADRAVQNGDERLRLAEGRYQAGAGSAIELGDAIVAQAAAHAQRAEAEYALATARARLVRALGRDD
jgi:outer membrane protein